MGPGDGTRGLEPLHRNQSRLSRALSRIYKPKPPNLTGLVEAAAFLALTTAGAGYLFGSIWPFEIFSHFRLQSTGGLFLLGFLLLFLRRRLLAVGCITVALLLSATIAPYFYPRAALTNTGQLKVLSFNVNSANENFEAVRNYLTQQNADIVFLMEVNEEWIKQLSTLRTAYPHQIIHPREDNFGLAVFSKHPFIREEILYFTDFDLPAAVFEVTIKETTYHIIGAHPLPPANGFNFHARNEELIDLARRISPTSPAIFMGDFNLTPFSPYFREILSLSGLRNSSLGLGLHPTWKSSNPMFAIPIDHILISQDLAVASREVGPSLGSDHNPIVLSVEPRGQ